MTLEPLADKWRAFDWEVFEMNGHDWDDIHAPSARPSPSRASPP